VLKRGATPSGERSGDKLEDLSLCIGGFTFKGDGGEGDPRLRFKGGTLTGCGL